MRTTNTDISFSSDALAERACTFSATLKQIFNGGGLVASYLSNVRTTKEPIMTVIASGSAFAINHDEWISYSHWGMFPVRKKISNSRGEA